MEDDMIAYRTTSGRLIDLWDFPSNHLGIASRLAALVQYRVASEPRLNEVSLRSEIQHSFMWGFGLHEDSPADDTLGIFVLDLAVKWLSQRQEVLHPPKGVSTWRTHLRERLRHALGLSNWGGQKRLARELGIDPSGGSRFNKALAKPLTPADCQRGDLLNYVEHLLAERTLRLTVTEGVPPDLVGRFGSFLIGAGHGDISYRVERVLLAVSRYVRFKRMNLDNVWPCWGRFCAAQSDLAWALGLEAGEILVSAVTGWLDRLLDFQDVNQAVRVHTLSQAQCSNPDVRTAFHLGLFDGSGLLPIPQNPEVLYNNQTTSGLAALNAGRFFPQEGLEDAIKHAGVGPFLSPGARVTLHVGEQAIAEILTEANRLRRTFPLAVWIATGGNVTP